MGFLRQRRDPLVSVVVPAYGVEAYLPECLDFKNGKAYANQRPGLGVTADMSRLTQISEVTEPGRRNVFRRPDGSLTHW